jgi:Flp pilus assembly protein TadB
VHNKIFALVTIFSFFIGFLIFTQSHYGGKKITALNRSRLSIKKRHEKFLQSVNALTELTGAMPSTLVLDWIIHASSPLLLLAIAVSFLSLEPLQLFLMALVIGIASVYRVNSFRRRIISRYRESIEGELADFIETLSIAVNSGLSFVGSFIRTSDEFIAEIPGRTNSLKQKWFKKSSEKNLVESPLQRELALVRVHLAMGRPIAQGLDSMSRRIESTMVSDLFDAVILTMGRGTPMADLLNNHAQNIRDSHSRALMEKAGRAEVRMMIPVIFLLLPISVLFALWPSFQQLQQMVVVA